MRRQRGVDEEGVEDHALDRDAEDARERRVLRGRLHLPAGARRGEEPLQRRDRDQRHDEHAKLCARDTATPTSVRSVGQQRRETTAPRRCRSP